MGVSFPDRGRSDRHEAQPAYVLHVLIHSKCTHMQPKVVVTCDTTWKAHRACRRYGVLGVAQWTLLLLLQRWRGSHRRLTGLNIRSIVTSSAAGQSVSIDRAQLCPWCSLLGKVSIATLLVNRIVLPL